MKKKPLTNKAGEVRELMLTDVRNMQAATNALPGDLLNVLPKRKVGERGPQKQPVKISITVRYSPEVVNYFKATGNGWQLRINKALKEWIKEHPGAA